MHSRNRLAWISGGDRSTREGSDLLLQRHHSLQRQVPLLYLSSLASFVGLHLATSGSLVNVGSPITVIVLLLLYRMGSWILRRGRPVTVAGAARQLRTTWFFACLFSLSFCLWAMYLFAQAATDRGWVLLFGSLASVGCAYGLSSFPGAARLPLILLGLPLAARAAATGDPHYIGAGMTLALIILLASKALSAHNEDLTLLSRSRSETATESERAREAERVANEERIRATSAAETDHLSGLPNRRAFMAALQDLVDELPPDATGAVALLDLDGFKPVNDAFGHAVGDSVLKLLGERLLLEFGQQGLCARIGGDEFAFLIRSCPGAAEARGLASNLCDLLDRPLSIDGRQFKISACCGVALLGHGDDLSQALLRADTALYRAKGRGRDRSELFSRDMERERFRRLHIERSLRDPAIRARIGLVFQPIFESGTGRLTAFEALARWDDDELGPVSPGEFIAIAEQIGVIEEISEDLLRKALATAAEWPDPIALSFNMSAIQLCSGALADKVEVLMRAAGFPAHRLQVEVTETVLLTDFDTARETLSRFRSMGAQVVLDDFGAGYASISYLQEMRFDGVKLDGSLLRRATKSKNSRNLLKGVIDLVGTLGLACVAEQVETVDQLNLLRDLECAKVQGFLMSMPLGAAAAVALARQGHWLAPPDVAGGLRAVA